MRRAVAAVAAAVLVVDALVLAFYNVVLGLAVRHQSMSLAGLKPSAMASGAFAAAGLMGVFLLACAFVLVRTAIRDRAPGYWPRLLLIGCAVVHAVLAAAVVSLVGWTAFAAMTVVFGFVVLTLMMYGPEPAAPAPVADEPAAPAAV